MIHTTNFVREAARFILQEARASLAARGTFRLALAGGDTPRPVYKALADMSLGFPWNKVRITFGDERCVPPDHEQSNYRMAREALLDRAPIPSANVLRIRGEIDPETAAAEYEEQLATLNDSADTRRFVHDLVLLGLGEDGHTASLFPGSAALSEMQRNVLAVVGTKPPPQRITFTLPLINAARVVCFLVKSQEKSAVVDAVIAGDPRYPASAVKHPIWILGY